jgi:20S proteasome subunit alpha 6
MCFIGEQASTQRYGRRPYGVGLLVIGVDDSGPHLYECCPSGNEYEYYAQAIGSRYQSARTHLEKHLDEFLHAPLNELIRHGLLALKDTLQQGTELDNKNCSIAIVGIDTEFTLIEGSALDPYLQSLSQ